MKHVLSISWIYVHLCRVFLHQTMHVTELEANQIISKLEMIFVHCSSMEEVRKFVFTMLIVGRGQYPITQSPQMISHEKVLLTQISLPTA